MTTIISAASSTWVWIPNRAVGPVGHFQYDGSATIIRISLYAKGEAADSFGTTLYESAWVAFSPSGTLTLAVNQSTASVTYPGVASSNLSHGLTFTNWTDGGIAVVDARNVSGHAIYAEFDNLNVERPNAVRGIPVCRRDPGQRTSSHYESRTHQPRKQSARP